MARTLMITALTALSAYLATSLQAATLTVVIEDIQSSEGQIMVEVLPSEAAFKEQQPAVASFILPAKTPSVSITLDALDGGEYGIRVMHDVDGDGTLDANMIGIPKEPWGFSNNAKGPFGPPGWNDVRFSIESKAEQTITLNH